MVGILNGILMFVFNIYSYQAVHPVKSSRFLVLPISKLLLLALTECSLFTYVVGCGSEETSRERKKLMRNPNTERILFTGKYLLARLSWEGPVIALGVTLKSNLHLILKNKSSFSFYLFIVYFIPSKSFIFKCWLFYLKLE